MLARFLCIAVLSMLQYSASQVSVAMSAECQCQLLSLDPESLPVLKALDAWGKPVGALMGTFTSMGDFKECLKINKDATVDGQVMFNYVMVEGSLNVSVAGQNVNLQSFLGICVPEVCGNFNDISAIFDFINLQIQDRQSGIQMDFVSMAGRILTGSMPSSDKGSVMYHVSQVHPHKPVLWSPGTWAMVIVWGCLALIAIFSTLVDHWFRQRKFCAAVMAEYQQLQSQQDSCGVTENDAVLFQSSSAETLLPKSELELLNVVKKRKQMSFMSVIQSFSLYNTLSALAHTSSKSFQELKILHMIRVVSICWVALGHTFSSYIENAPVDALDAIDLVKSPAMMLIMNAFLSVDTFFYLSGFLVAYMIFSDPKSAQRFNYVKYVLLRYIRLTPTAMIVMLTWWFIFPILGGGNQYNGSPMWYRKVDHVNKACPQYWWTHLIYIANFYPKVIGQECDPPYWYLSADMHLYLVAPLFMLPLISKRKLVSNIGWILLMLVGVIGQALWTMIPSILMRIPALPTPVNDAQLGIRDIQRDMAVWQENFYQKSYNHLSVLIIGIVTAYLCVQQRQRQTTSCQIQASQFSKRVITKWRFRAAAIHAIGGALLLSTLLLPNTFAKNMSRWQSAEANALYHYMSRIVWSIGLSMIIWPSITSPVSSVDGKNQRWSQILFIEQLASWNFWTVLGRLTFCVYLTHCLVINLQLLGTLREQSYSWPLFLTIYGGVLLWSHLIAVIVYALVEQPLNNIVKLLLK
ncbi:hypothetical protein MP228_004491 [Amoeboaphelidium protococcarum]|nr:hypothetical protein MP228_004491 [Amoeboaphelidium protococcarum]